MPVTDFAFDFRATLAFVTDPNYASAVLAETYPHTYTNGLSNSITGGFVGGNVASRDRNASNDPRLAGINVNNSGNATGPFFTKFRVDLPQTGQWSIWAAFSDPSNPQQQYVTFLDNVTSIASYSNVATNANQFMDASGNLWSQATFFANQVPIVYVFASTMFFVQVGPSSSMGSLSTTLSFLRITAPSGTAMSEDGGWPAVSNTVILSPYKVRVFS
jgi:hypothetical protein